MVRSKDGQDHFVEEPALAYIADEGTSQRVGPSAGRHVEAVLPVRVFEKQGELHARVHRLVMSESGASFVIQGSGWFNIPISALLLSFPRFLEHHEKYSLPSPTSIDGASQRTPAVMLPC